MQKQVAHLAKYVSDEDVLMGNLHWAPTPGESKREMRSSTCSSSSSDLEDGAVAGAGGEMHGKDWREAVSESGEVYYWNVQTRETRWKK